MRSSRWQRAGVHTVDPSYNKQFIWPCVASHGRRRVLEILLDLARHGSDLEKAGAANAWYWGEMPGSTICESQYYGLQVSPADAERRWRDGHA